MVRRKRRKSSTTKAAQRNKKHHTKTTQKNIRKDPRWEALYEDLKRNRHNFKTSEEFNKYIDNLYNMKKIDQKDILGSFKSFITK